MAGSVICRSKASELAMRSIIVPINLFWWFQMCVHPGLDSVDHCSQLLFSLPCISFTTPWWRVTTMTLSFQDTAVFCSSPDVVVGSDKRRCGTSRSNQAYPIP